MKGLKGVFALGDCSCIEDYPLPATAQVASQEGAYLGRLFNKGFEMETSAPLPPARKIEIQSLADFSDNDSGNANQYSTEQYLSERMRLGQLGVQVESINEGGCSRDIAIELAKPFQFLNLGVLAYIGASQALAQINVNTAIIRSSGQLGFLLWRGIYWFKQVSWRNRILVYIDWCKAILFGRDLGMGI